MGKIIVVIKREYLERVRSKWFVMATVFGPIVMAVMMFMPAYLASKSKPSADVSDIVILDASGSGLGARVAKVLSTFSGTPTVQPVSPSELALAESTVTRRVMRKETQGYLVVDRVTVAGEGARYAGRNASSITDMDLLQETVRQAVLGMRFENAGLDAQKVRALSSIRLKVYAERLNERGRGGSGRGSVVLAYVIAVLLYMGIVLYGQAILTSVIEEKTQRVAEVVVASIPPEQLLAGKVVGVGAVGLSQLLVWVVSGILLMNFQQPIMLAFGYPAVNPVQMPSVSLLTMITFPCFYVLGFIFFASLYAAAGSMVSTTQDAQQLATPLTFLIVPSLLLLGPVLQEPSGTLARTASLVPITAAILMPVRMSLTSVPWWEIAGAMVLLILSCFGAVWLAARIYRVGVLMYGKKPSLAEVARWVRYAR